MFGIGLAPAFADDAGPPTPPSSEGQTLDEVVVTAQFRQQRLETTPVAITALSGAQLDEHNASSLANLNGLAPNLAITAGTNTNGPSAQTFIRGIGQSDAIRVSSPASVCTWMTSTTACCWGLTST